MRADEQCNQQYNHIAQQIFATIDLTLRGPLMGRAKPIILESITFATHTKALEFFSQMLNRYYPGERISAEDASHLSSLLKRHPDYSRKAASGIDFFEVMIAADYGSKCFFIVRPDGGREDFSFRRCITLSEK